MPVLLAFKEEKGIEILNSMLRAFATAVGQGSDSASDASSRPKVAAFGLKKILDLYFILVNGKYITETNNHFNLQRQTDRTQTVPNVHHQIVVEFRAAILPAITELWNSSFVERVPDLTVKRLLDILKMIAAGDNEPQSTPNDKLPFLLFNYTDVRFNWRAVRMIVDELSSAGFDEDLVHEAVYRSNGEIAVARGYCRAHKTGLAGPRNPIPPEDADTSALADGGSSRIDREPSNGTSASDADRMSLDAPPELPGDILGDLVDQSSDEFRVDLGHESQPPAGPAPVNDTEASDEQAAATKQVATKESLDELRSKLSDNLIDQCLDVIRAHSGSAIEVAELIQAMFSRQPNSSIQEEVCSTLTFALTSMIDPLLEDPHDEELLKRDGKCIAAYIHLLALLMQDESFFERNHKTIQLKVGEYMHLLSITQELATDELPPWIPFVLLVVESALCSDERPVAVQWKAPKSLDDGNIAPPPSILNPPARMVNDTQRSLVLKTLIELLPRVGKEETLATSILRILVILTRNHEYAKQVGQKRNLQRLFLMAKQLSGLGSERLKQTKLTARIMTILRHIVEDDDTVKQVMRAEIKAEFPNLVRTQRGHPEVAAYLRQMAPVALRNTKLFVEVTNEMLQFSRWAPTGGEAVKSQPLTMREQENEQTDGAGQTGEASSSAADIKPSTESADKDMTDAPKQQDSKPLVVQNPDDVIHFLLCELVNYREVDDKEPPIPGRDAKTEADSSADSPATSKDAPDGKDKKPSKPVFKAEEHPIFVYRCFLLNCLTELLQSYNRTKVEFINFKRSAPPQALPSIPVKPRSSILNYLIYDLLCQGNLSGTTDSIASKKKAATSSQTQKVLVALVSKTNEKAVDRTRDKFAYDEEADLLFVRKFVLDTILKAYERAPLSDEPLETRYSRMQCLAELMNHMIGDRDKEQASGVRASDNNQSRSQAQLRRLMYEKGYLDKLTSSIAEINLNYPGVKRAIKYILRVLRVLTDTAKELSHSNILPSDSLHDNSDDEIASTSSLSDLDDGREDTPDLYRNSTLGMLEPRGEEDESEDDDDEEDDEDMYGDEYDDDEMEYGDEISDADDNISDEDEELSQMGEIEGLHGDPGVVEVIMDDDDDDDEDDSDDEDDEVESADMEDMEDRVEIVDEDGNPLDDDGSAWESDSDDDDEHPDGDDLDYEADVQAEDEAHIHAMGPGDLLDNMARAIMGEDHDYEPELMDGLDEPYLDEGHEDGGKSPYFMLSCESLTAYQRTTKMRTNLKTRSISTMTIIHVGGSPFLNDALLTLGSR